MEPSEPQRHRPKRKRNHPSHFSQAMTPKNRPSAKKSVAGDSKPQERAPQTRPTKMRPHVGINKASRPSAPRTVPSDQERGWDEVAQWYDELVGDQGSDYHRHVILPALFERLNLHHRSKCIDLCCGQGFLGPMLLKSGAESVLGIDASPQLIHVARERTQQRRDWQEKLLYVCTDAAAAGDWADGSFDVLICLLAIHDVRSLDGLLRNVRLALKMQGKAYFVFMHPCFRVPQQTHWGWQDQPPTQYRRIEAYRSTRQIQIITHPGKAHSESTIFYHRSLSEIIETSAKNHLAVVGCEELCSHRRSQVGPRSQAEHHAAAEIPMFMLLEMQRIS